MAYHQKLPKESTLHDSFHISKLRPYKGLDPTREVPLIPKLVVQNQPILTPISFVDYRVVYRQNKIVPRLLVQWGGAIQEDAIWEDISCLRKLLPNLQLEDKVLSEGDTHEAILIPTSQIESAFLEETTRIEGLKKQPDRGVEETEPRSIACKVVVVQSEESSAIVVQQEGHSAEPQRSVRTTDPNKAKQPSFIYY